MRGATGRRGALIVVLAVLGVSDYLVLNVVVWPRCVEQGARSETGGMTLPTSRLTEPDASLGAKRESGVGRGPTKGRDLEAPDRVPPAAEDLVVAAPVTVESVETLSEGKAISSDEHPLDTTSSTIALPEIDDLLFWSKSAALSKRVKGSLEKVVSAMLEDRQLHVFLRGHADDRGNEPANQRLSERRASETARYLREQGISLDRIEIEGVGEREPADRSGTEAARAKNRRVEVIWHRRDTP